VSVYKNTGWLTDDWQGENTDTAPYTRKVVEMSNENKKWIEALSDRFGKFADELVVESNKIKKIIEKAPSDYTEKACGKYQQKLFEQVHGLSGIIDYRLDELDDEFLDDEEDEDKNCLEGEEDKEK
jgi:uncharacterized protein YlaN (UPF0358 family)